MIPAKKNNYIYIYSIYIKNTVKLITKWAIINNNHLSYWDLNDQYFRSASHPTITETSLYTRIHFSSWLFFFSIFSFSFFLSFVLFLFFYFFQYRIILRKTSWVRPMSWCSRRRQRCQIVGSNRTCGPSSTSRCTAKSILSVIKTIQLEIMFQQQFIISSK